MRTAATKTSRSSAKTIVHEALEANALHPERAVADGVISLMASSRRLVFITGAGVSVAAGIPDFRSMDGMYKLMKEKHPDVVLKGQELFDVNLFRSPATTAAFYMMMGEMKSQIDGADATGVHRFIKWLDEQKKLLRCYTQNIDGLEERVGLPCQASDISKKAKVVQLHGSLKHLSCTHCRHRLAFGDDHAAEFKDGNAPECPKCADATAMRQAQGRRALAVGALRPDILLYNQVHAESDNIAMLMNRDIASNPDMLIVMGTSLKIPGVKMLVKAMRKRLNEKEGPRMVLVNYGEVGSEWKDVFDVIWSGDVQHVVAMMRRGIEELQRRKKKPASTKPPKSTSRQQTLLELLPATHENKPKEESSEVVTTSSPAPVDGIVPGESKRMQRSKSAASTEIAVLSAVKKSPTKKLRSQTDTKHAAKARTLNLDQVVVAAAVELEAPLAKAELPADQENTGNSPERKSMTIGGRQVKSRSRVLAPTKKTTGRPTEPMAKAISG